MQRFQKKCKKCKDFKRNAKISKEMQRFQKKCTKCKDFIRICKNKKFLTSEVKLHLGGLGGKWAVASDNYSPLYIPFSTFSPLYVTWVWGEKKGEKIVAYLPDFLKCCNCRILDTRSFKYGRTNPKNITIIINNCICIRTRKSCQRIDIVS